MNENPVVEYDPTKATPDVAIPEYLDPHLETAKEAMKEHSCEDHEHDPVAEIEAKENSEPPKCPKCGEEVKEGTFEVLTLSKKMRIDKSGKTFNPNVAICKCGQDLGLAGFTPMHIRKAKYASPKHVQRKKLARKISNKARKANRNK
jgi:hypothetical protein